MRDIKFRAWDKVSRIWLDTDEYVIYPDDGVVAEIEETNTLELVDINHEAVLEQYTGLKDKNGVDIYEGDIVQHVREYEDFPEIEPTKIGLPLVVDFGSYVYGKWIAREINETGFGVNDYQFSKDLAVIGNIHENAYLLEEQS